jgi:hypothetical protein
MPAAGSNRRLILPHSVDGGYNTEAGPSAPHAVRENGSISVPYLTRANNIVWTLDGWFRKMPGAENVNSTATGASDHVIGIFDYWRSQTSGDPTQQRIVVAGTQIYRESSGTMTSIQTGIEAQRMPWFEVANDVLLIATTSTTDVPWTWNQTTFANLGGSPPNFSFMVNHKNHIFAAGVESAKSRLYYSANGASVAAYHADWSHSSSGSIDVAPDDGDVITGLWSHHNQLIVFKGPYKGSIFRVTGSSGSDWALQPMFRGVGATNQQAIIERAGDLIFWDDMGIHSLATTENFGDYTPAFVSADIADHFIRELNHSRFNFVWGANFAAAGYALWTVSRAGSSTNNEVILWDYRFNPTRFALWPAYSLASLAIVRDASRETVPWGGTYTGRVRRMNRVSRNIAGSAYTADVIFPYLGYGDAFIDKTIAKGRVSYSPKGGYNFTVGWQRDGNTQQTATVAQSGTATLAPSSDEFVLDTSTLGGGQYIPNFFNMNGPFKEIQYEFTQTGLDQDFEPHGFAVEVEIAGVGEARLLG